MARTAAFLLLKDSKAFYAIEGENPPQNRAQHWERAIGQAGQRPISKEELVRLQQSVYGDISNQDLSSQISNCRAGQGNSDFYIDLLFFHKGLQC